MIRELNSFRFSWYDHISKFDKDPMYTMGPKRNIWFKKANGAYPHRIKHTVPKTWRSGKTDIGTLDEV